MRTTSVVSTATAATTHHDCYLGSLQLSIRIIIIIIIIIIITKHSSNRSAPATTEKNHHSLVS
jgi:hypothetical protein